MYNRFDVLGDEDPGLSPEEFKTLVKELVERFNMLPRIWLQAPGLFS